MAASTRKAEITSSSTAEYFSKNLQQVGFSSLTKSVLTTLKEAVDNSLDACEEAGIMPSLNVTIEKKGAGTLKGSDLIRVVVDDNGPGIDPEDLAKVFGEYLASSKFGRGRCSRGQQGIGISAATTWAQLTNATGVRVITKTKAMRKAVSAVVEVDIKKNSGNLKERESLDWDRDHGTSVEFVFDGRLQLNGEGGILTYLTGTSLVNPHLELKVTLPSSDPEKKKEEVVFERVSQTVPQIPDAVEPHPHTMKLGEFIAHSHLFGKTKVSGWLKKGYSRVSDMTLDELVKSAPKGSVVNKSMLDKNLESLADSDFRELFNLLQALPLKAPSTQSVMAIGEETLSKSIQRIGQVDFFSVVSRKPTICDFKPVLIEVAIARLLDKAIDPEASVEVLRFANRVPLQFDKSACAIVKAITTVNWRSYGLAQPKNGLPIGPYIIAVSVVSPFIKFKNASKETIDASDELVEEIRRALIQAGQRLSRHIRREDKANELEERIRHIEQFGPILVEGLGRITSAPASRIQKASEGLRKLLGRDASDAEKALDEAQERLAAQEAKRSSSAGEKDVEADA